MRKFNVDYRMFGIQQLEVMDLDESADHLQFNRTQAEFIRHIVKRLHLE